MAGPGLLQIGPDAMDEAAFERSHLKLNHDSADAATVATILLEGPPREAQPTHRSKIHPVN